MGFYIQTPTNLSKVAYLRKEHGVTIITLQEAIRIVQENDDNFAALCCVDNGAFQAVGLMFNMRELEDFTDPSDRRTKTYLKMDKKLAWKLSGFSDIVGDNE